jgi:hypothetical protein
MANIAPHNFLREIGQDVQLENGIWLKKGTCITPQISVVLCDEKVSEIFLNIFRKVPNLFFSNIS